jgi:hypothetical protein
VLNVHRFLGIATVSIRYGHRYSFGVRRLAVTAYGVSWYRCATAWVASTAFVASWYKLMYCDAIGL